jgi:hypothetical protein
MQLFRFVIFLSNLVWRFYLDFLSVRTSHWYSCPYRFVYGVTFGPVLRISVCILKDDDREVTKSGAARTDSLISVF